MRKILVFTAVALVGCTFGPEEDLTKDIVKTYTPNGTLVKENIYQDDLPQEEESPTIMAQCGPQYPAKKSSCS